MDVIDKCKAILRNMRAKGKDVADQSAVDSWTWDEMHYFIDNYGPYYL